MVEMRRAGYHPLEIVIRAAAFILLMVGESNCDSKVDYYDFALLRNRGQATNNVGAPYIPFQYNEPAPHKILPNKDDTNHRIIFPDDDAEIFSRIQEEEDMIKNPAKCENSFYCENPSYYPTELVNNILSKNKSLKNFFLDDNIVDIAQRGDIPNQTGLCSTFPKRIYPKTMKDKSGLWKVIVQDTDQDAVQGVVIETCRNESKPCEFITSTPLGYKTYCKQMYVSRQLLVLREGGVVEPEPFPVPWSCCCSVILDK